MEKNSEPDDWWDPAENIRPGSHDDYPDRGGLYGCVFLPGKYSAEHISRLS